MTLVFRLLYRLNRFSAGLQHWAQRRFTPAGLLVLASLAFAALIAPDTDNNVAYQGLTVLFFLLVLAVTFSWFFRGRFSTNRNLPRFGTAGAPFTYTLEVRNLGTKTQAGLVLLDNLADARPAFADWLAVQQADQKHLRSFRMSSRRRSNPFKPATLGQVAVPPLPAGQRVAVAVQLTPLRRGLLRLSGITLARADPLGLFRGFVKLPLPQSVLILPKRYALPQIRLPGTMKYQQGGVAQAAHVGQSEEFVALRDYRHGDPLRHIHWRSWARVGKPVVKEFEDEFFVRHALVLDTFTDEPYGEVFEEAVAVAASFACTLGTQESLLDLLFVGPDSFCFTAGRGLAHTDQMLEILAGVRACRQKSFQALEHLVLDHVARVTGCVCVMLSWDSARQEFVRKLKALGLPVLVLVVAPAGKNNPLDPGPLKDEPEQFIQLEAGKIQEGLTRLK
jgi:uncharacterized protein (DUF58 family)